MKKTINLEDMCKESPRKEFLEEDYQITINKNIKLCSYISDAVLHNYSLSCKHLGDYNPKSKMYCCERPARVKINEFREISE